MKKHFVLLALTLASLLTFAQNANTFLWRITAPQNDSSSYLFGTIHLPQEKFMQLSDSVYKAIGTTTVFYNEINYMGLGNEMAEISAFSKNALTYMDSVHKTASWRNLIKNINRVYGQQLHPDSKEDFTTFSQGLMKDLFKPDAGVAALDVALAGFATVMGKPTKGLERYVTQLSMLYKLLDARLADTTLLFTDDIRMNKDLIRFYQYQRLDSIERLVATIHPAYRNLVFDDRNKTMGDSMSKAMAASTAFFAVGAGHLTGNNGLISLLKQRGYKVSPVLSANTISITLMGDLFETAAENIRRLIKKKEQEEDSFMVPPPPPLEGEKEMVQPAPKKASIKPATKTKRS